MIALLAAVPAVALVAAADQSTTAANQETLIAIAAIGFAGTIIASIIGNLILAVGQHRATDRAVAAASDAKDATKTVARRLTATSTRTTRKLVAIKAVADGTHQIVNSDRTKMLGSLAYALRRIADQNPNNEEDQAAATAAEDQAGESKSAAAAIAGTGTERAAKRAVTRRSPAAPTPRARRGPAATRR
jgi:hypothetical protein